MGTNKPQTSNREHFPRPNAPKLTKENMFDFVVKGAQQDFAEEQANGQKPAK